MKYRLGSDDPTANVRLMTALGRLVVRASEFDEHITGVLALLCYVKMEKRLKHQLVSKKLKTLRSVAEQASIEEQVKQVKELCIQLSSFCQFCLSKLDNRNSPVHSTYISDEGGWFIKWDAKRGIEKVKPDQIEAVAGEFKGLTEKAVDYQLQIGDLRESGVLKNRYLGRC